MKALKNTWYVAGLVSEIAVGQMAERTILGEIVLLFKTHDGKISAIGGVCPHRFAPLAFGRMVDDTIECGYHGLRFDSDGKCVHNPRGDGLITERNRVKKYPIVARAGMFWIWMGESDLADSALIPHFGWADEAHDDQILDGYLLSPAHYRVVLDNLLDPSHADYVHPDILTSYGRFSDVPAKIEREERSIGGTWAYDNFKSQPSYQAMQIDPNSLTDQEHLFKWHAPSIVEINAVIREPGNPQVFRNWSIHAVTPRDDTSAHYWFFISSNYANFGGEFRQIAREATIQVFENQDGPMLDAVDRMMAGRDFWDLEPVILDGDQLSVLTRRQLDKMIREEETGKVEISTAA